ncbi:MAG: hypothetical protein PHX68_04085 [Alphaproteobacteria bacterium]|nr:hypothetical protein [Alphaproteobacteria bacterium]
MQEPILKAVAMPPRIFWAPMVPALGNFLIQGVFLLMWITTNHNPIVFIPSILAVHVFLIVYGVRDPHLSNMLKSFGRKGGGMAVSKNIYSCRGNKLAP